MNTDAPLDFRDSHEWHKWLLQNHDKVKEAWVIIHKRHSRGIGIILNDAVEEALCFGWIDGKIHGLDDEKFVLKFSPRKARSVWSRINKEKVEMLIMQGKMRDAGLARIEEAKKNGYWDAAYTNKISDEMPEDLKEVLMEDAKAWNNFEKFANSYRNMYIGWVTGAKTEETRRKRITEVVRRSVLNKKPGIE